MGKKKTKPSKKEVARVAPLVPVKFHIPDTIITRFATNMTVQMVENEFKISFFELKPELRFDSDQTPPPSEIKADCVASVFVTADKLSRFIKVLEGQLKQYNSDNKK